VFCDLLNLTLCQTIQTKKEQTENVSASKPMNRLIKKEKLLRPTVIQIIKEIQVTAAGAPAEAGHSLSGTLCFKKCGACTPTR